MGSRAPPTPGSRERSKRAASGDVPEEAKLAKSASPRTADDKSQEGTSGKKKGMNETPDHFGDIRNMSHEYAVKVDSDYEYTTKAGLRTINQDSEFAEIRRIGSNEDIQEIDGENHPQFSQLTQEQQMELIARQEYQN